MKSVSERNDADETVSVSSELFESLMLFEADSDVESGECDSSIDFNSQTELSSATSDEGAGVAIVDSSVSTPLSSTLQRLR